MTGSELVGSVLASRYPLKRVIGAGAMGIVFESTSPDDGQPIAVKLLGADYRNDPNIKARFLEEGRACQRLIHPNIVRVLDVAEAPDGTAFIVMELLEGVPLSTYVRSSVRLPIGQAATIVQGVLAGLGAAHAQRIVHRDLKPDNVFLAREDGGAFTPKILDFGMAKVMDAAGGMGSKSRSGVLLGTPAYMSPEQIRSGQEIDARSDLWSAGVLLYEMLTGRVAFPAPTEYARLTAVLNTTPQPLESVDPSLSRLSAFVQLALQKDREQRYQSALEMARALAGALGTEAMTGAPLSQLPNVASVWMPKPASSVIPVPMTAVTPEAPRIAAKATLASPGQLSEPRVQVSGTAVHGTLPSENLPMLSPQAPVVTREPGSGVPAAVVVVLVASALVIGFALGALVMRAIH